MNLNGDVLNVLSRNYQLDSILTVTFSVITKARQAFGQGRTDVQTTHRRLLFFRPNGLPAACFDQTEQSSIVIIHRDRSDRKRRTGSQME